MGFTGCLALVAEILAAAAVTTPITAASAAGVSSAATTLLLTDQDCYKLNALESKLLACTAKEIHRSLRRLVGGPQLNADRLTKEMREILLHLAIENEGDVGIELLLKLVELLLSEFPRAGLEHG